MEIRLEKVKNNNFFVYWNNNTLVGTFEMNCDGYYYFWANDSPGSWSSYALRLVADKLDEINKPFKEVVDEYFDQERKDFEERARIEYRKLLNETGMFWEWYPQLTGDWNKDKLDWFVEYSKLEERRTSNIGF